MIGLLVCLSIYSFIYSLDRVFPNIKYNRIEWHKYCFSSMEGSE